MVIKIIFNIILLFSFFILASSRAWFRYQCVGFDLTFTCNGKKYSNVNSVLYDYMTPFWNTIGSFRANNDSSLYFTGVMDTFVTFNPYLYLYHQCNENDPMCQTEFYIHIPKTYVYNGKRPEKFLKKDIELGNKYLGQNRQCIRNGKLVKNVPYPKKTKSKKQ
uniref:Uncharacterized protein n=1 Tax=Strongyloides papillosus TaxID=174720 RepID=A0A0N5C3C8_STREA